MTKEEKLARDLEIVTAFKNGVNIEEICKKFKCGNGKVYRLLKLNNISKDRYAVKDAIKESIKEEKKREQSRALQEKKKLDAKRRFDEEEMNFDPALPQKVCNKCSFSKPLSRFSKLAASPDGLNYQCKKCISTYMGEYSKNYFVSEEKRSIKNKNEANIRKQRALLVNSYKNNPCKDCGQKFDPYLMDFDHLPEFDKIESVTRLAMQKAPVETIKAEIAKCELVCVWCHYTRTHNRSKLKHNNDGFPPNGGRREKAILSWKLRDVPCQICNVKYEPYQMQFDHLPGYVKIDNVTNLVNKNRPDSIIMEEVAKCQIICCGCHRTKSLKSGKVGG